MERDSSRISGRDGDLIDRLSSLERDANGIVVGQSDSSLAGGVSGRIGSCCGVRCGIMVILRTRDTTMDASAAISLTRDRALVENTT